MEDGNRKTETRYHGGERRVKSELVAAEAGAIEAVIFDMDGVLIDSEPIHSEATRAVLADLGIEYVPDVREDLFGLTDWDVFHALRTRYGLAEDEGQLSAAWVARSVKLLSRPLVPMPGVPDVLHALRRAGIRLALASSSAPPIIAATLNGLGLSSLFEITVSGHDVSRENRRRTSSWRRLAASGWGRRRSWSSRTRSTDCRPPLPPASAASPCRVRPLPGRISLVRRSAWGI